MERKHRHVAETALTMLSAASLPHKFWYHVVAHAVFLINRMPTKILRMDSPFERLFHTKRDISSLKVFGSAIYPYLRPYNDHQLQSRTSQCVFLGFTFGYKGVICYNIATERLLMSRHVIHDENCFPFAALRSTSRSQCSEVGSYPSYSTRPVVVHLSTASSPNSLI